MLPVRALPPSAAEHRLLISDAIEQQQQQLGSVSEDVPVGGGGESAAVAGSPLLERVRRSISELTQQVDGAQAQPPSSNSSAGGESNGAVARVRPMTMEESAGLHAWIKHGLLAAAAGGGIHGNHISGGDGRAVGAHAERDLLPPALSSSSSSLSVVRKPQQLARANRQLDYAMLYCPSMQHVLLGGDVDDVGGGGIAARYRPSAPRVIHGSDAVVAESPSALDDVDDSVPLADIYSSSRVERHDAGGGSSDLLVPTQAGENSLLLQMPRPKMSLYSPVVARGGDRLNDGHDGADILAPWEEYARTDPKREEDPAAAAGGRQKYLRIDVEVVGSRWVTADKFASGLY
ncbi:hypothetical protein GGF42_000920 [Coemansia sp. RSA 2424]|nr:hypothetical protein GGF42_000920 [Coemansia sp. RSA 2424]